MKTIDVKKLGNAEVIVDIVQKGNPEIRPAYPMNPIEIAVHNTGNAGRGANAKAHNTYIHNQSRLPVAKTGYASWHFSVDDKFIYQHIPLDESAWHTGDGSAVTSGNRIAIGIEICENPETNTHQAEENAIALIVYLMKAFGIGIDKVKPHQAYSGKFCPRVILGRDGSLEPFKKRIILAKAETKVKPAPVVNTSKPVSTPASHIVKSGETLWGISKATGVPVADIKALNGLKSDTITIGQVLKLKRYVPAPKPAPVQPKPVPAPKPAGIKAVGKIKIANLSKFTYIYAKASDTSARVGEAPLGHIYDIAGSIPNWYEIIYQGKRAYVKTKYAVKL